KAAGAGRLPGNLLLLGTDHAGYAGRVARPGRRREPARGTVTDASWSVAGPPRFGGVPGVALPEMPDRPGTLKTLAVLRTAAQPGGKPPACAGVLLAEGVIVSLFLIGWLPCSFHVLPLS